MINDDTDEKDLKRWLNDNPMFLLDGDDESKRSYLEAKREEAERKREEEERFRREREDDIKLARRKLAISLARQGGDAINADAFHMALMNHCFSSEAERLAAAMEDCFVEEFSAFGGDEAAQLFDAYRQEVDRIAAKLKAEAEQRAREEAARQAQAEKQRHEAERKAEEARAEAKRLQDEARRAEAKAAKKRKAKEKAEQLADGLELLALQYKFMVRGYRNWQQLKQINDIEEDGPQDRWFVAFTSLLDRTLGSVGCDDTETFFGQSSGLVVRINILARAEVLDKWTAKGALLEKLGIKQRDDIRLHLEHAKRLHTLYTDEDGMRWHWKGHGRKDGESFADLLKVIEATEQDFQQLAMVAENCAGDVDTINEVYERANRVIAPPQFLVEGLIAKNVITMLAGAEKHGKSTLALQLAVAVAKRESHWLGLPLNVSPGLVVFLSGEDPEELVRQRVELMTDGDVPLLLWVSQAGTLDDLIEQIGDKPIALLCVDPARKYLDGDEDGSDAVSKFFTKLEELARAKNAPVVVQHHLKRNAMPQSIDDIPMLIRGSQVWLDRPRAILGLLRRRDGSTFGICKRNGIPLHNFPASSTVSRSLRLQFDTAAHRHDLIENVAKTAEQPVVDEEAKHAVLAAARRLLGEGVHITRTGRTELHAYKSAELEGLTRAAIRAAVDALVEEGKLVNDDGVIKLPEVQ
jgi:hypothetical protein